MQVFKIILKRLFVFIVFGGFSNNVFALKDPYPKNPNIDVINYIFDIELSDKTDEIYCEVTIDIIFQKKGIEKIRLDLVNASDEMEQKGMNVLDVKSKSNDLKFIHKNNELWIYMGDPSEKNEKKKFIITYKGIPAEGLKIGDNKYGDRTFFSDNWPNRARHWLSTVDHPYDKAKCEFIVTAPDHYQVISNGLKIEETNLLGDGKKLTHWKQSVPIASWLYVLGVAEFAVQYVDKFDGKSIQTWVYKQDRDAGFYDFEEPTKKALEFYSSYIGPFAYEKLANIQSNSVSGGMESASAILYSDKSVVGDRNTRWRNVVIHEVAHQWFGNSVTEYDWDDIWLSEGFATYFTLLFIEHQYGRDEFVEGLISSQKRVDSFHKKFPNYTVIHNNLKDMKDVTSSQTYQKGSWFLHMLRGVLGTDIFWQGIRAYYLKFKDLNASTKDFKNIMELESGMNLDKFFEQWLYKAGVLELEGNWFYDDLKNEIIVKINQIQENKIIIEMPIEIGIKYQNNIETIEKIELREKSSTYKIKVNQRPIRVSLDPNFWVLMNSNFKETSLKLK